MYAYLARKGDSDLYLAFRGTMCLPSVKVDLDYHPVSDDEVDVLRRALAVGGDAVALPQGVQLHGGFLKTWLRSREEILAIDALRTVDTGATKMKMHVTGHSMGGALGMLASLELAPAPRAPSSTSSTSTRPTRSPRRGRQLPVRRAV